MSSEILERDENHRTVAAGIGNDADQDVLMFRVDAVTNYLLVDVKDSDAALGNTGTIAKRDGNHVPVCMAYDESNDQVVEVLTDENGYLLVDIAFV